MPTPIDTFLNPPAAPPAAAPEAAPPRPPAGPIDLFLNPPADPARAGQDLRLSEFRRQYAAAPDRGEEPLEYLARRGVPFASAAAGTAEKNVYAAARRRFDEGRATDYDLHAIAQFERDEHDRQQGQKSFLGELAHAGASAPAVIGEFAAGGALLRGAGLFTKALPEGASLGARAGRVVAEAAAKTPLMPGQYAERAAQNAIEKGGEATDAKNLGPALLHGALNVAVLGSLQKVANGVSPAALRVGAKGGIGVLEQAGVDVVAGAAGLQTGYGVLGDLANGKRGEALQHAAVQALTFSAFALAHGRPEESKKILDTAAETLNQQARSGVTPDRAAGKVTADLPGSPTEAAKAYQKGEEKAGEPEQRPTPGETPEGGNVATPEDPLAHWSDKDVWDAAINLGVLKSGGKIDRQRALEAMRAKGLDVGAMAEASGGKAPKAPLQYGALEANREWLSGVSDADLAAGLKKLGLDATGDRSRMETLVGGFAPETFARVKASVEDARRPLTPRQRVDAVTAERDRSDERVAAAERNERAARERAELLNAPADAKAAHAAARKELGAARKERKDVQARLDAARDEAVKAEVGKPPERPQEAPQVNPNFQLGAAVRSTAGTVYVETANGQRHQVQDLPTGRVSMDGSEITLADRSDISADAVHRVVDASGKVLWQRSPAKAQEAPQAGPEPPKPPEPTPTPERPSGEAVGPPVRGLPEIPEGMNRMLHFTATPETAAKIAREGLDYSYHGTAENTADMHGRNAPAVEEAIRTASYGSMSRKKFGDYVVVMDVPEREARNHYEFRTAPGRIDPNRVVGVVNRKTGEFTPKAAPESPPTPAVAKERPILPDLIEAAGLAHRHSPDWLTPEVRAEMGGETEVLDYGGRFVALQYHPERGRVSIDFDYTNKGEPAANLVANTAVPKEVQAGSVGMLRDLQKLVKTLHEHGVGIEERAEPRRHAVYEKALRRAGYELVSQKQGPEIGEYVWEPKKAAESNRPELIPQPKPAPERGNVATGREAVLARYPAPTGRGNVATDPGASLARVRAAQAAREPVPFKAPPKVERPIDTGEAVYHGEEMLSEAADVPVSADEAGAILDYSMSAIGLAPGQAHVIRQRLLGRTQEEIAADPEVRKKDGSAYTRQRIQQMEKEALVKLGLEPDTADELVAGDASHYAALGKLIEPGQQRFKADEATQRIRQKRTEAEKTHEESVRQFFEERKSAKRKGLNTDAADRVAGVTHGRGPQGPAGPQEAGGAQPPGGAGEAQRPGQAPVRRGGRRGAPAPPGEPAPQAAGEENAAVAARPPGPGAGEVPGAEPGAGGRDDLAAAAVRGEAAGHGVDPDLATRRPRKGETRIGKVGDRVRYDPEQHDLEPGGGTKATGEVVRAGIKDANGNVIRKPLVRRHALQDEEAAFRAAKAREEEAAYHEEQARAASEGPVPDHPDLSFEFGHLGLPEPPPTGANEVGGVPGRNGPLGVRQANPQGEFALAREKVTQEREQRGLPPVAEAARRSNPVAWNEARARLDADPNAGYQLVDRLEADPQSVRPDADVPLLLLHRVALSNAHDKAVSDYNRRAGQFGFVGGEMRRTATEAELEPLRRRAEDLAHERNRLDNVTAAVGTQLGRGLQYFRQLAREDYSLSGMLGQAKFAKGGQDLTPGEATRVAAAHQEVTRADKALGDAEGGNVATGGVDPADLRIAVRKARRGWADTLADLKLSGSSRTQKVIAGAREGLNASRSLITSMDFSAVFRQGGFLSFGHPVRALRALPDMFRAFASSKNFERQQDAIDRRPNAELYRRSGLYLADVDGRPTAQEEAFVGRLARNIPGVAASERAYVSFLNRLRADTFDSMVSGLSRGGRPTNAEAKAVANFVNVATGRGGLGPLENAAQPLAQIFFSPRYVASRFQILAGQPLYGGNVATRKLVAQEYARFLAGVGVFTALALAADDKAKYTLDPRSSDFGKIKMGNTRIDPLTGLSQAGVFVTRGATGETRSATSGRQSDLRGAGVRFGGQTEESVFTRFVRSKLAPIPGVLGDVYTGQKVTGERITAPVALPGGATVPRGTGAAVAREAGQLLVPMAGRDVVEALEDQGVPRGAAAGLLGVFGMGSQTFTPGKK